MVSNPLPEKNHPTIIMGNFVRGKVIKKPYTSTINNVRMTLWSIKPMKSMLQAHNIKKSDLGEEGVIKVWMHPSEVKSPPGSDLIIARNDIYGNPGFIDDWIGDLVESIKTKEKQIIQRDCEIITLRSKNISLSGDVKDNISEYVDTLEPIKKIMKTENQDDLYPELKKVR